MKLNYKAITRENGVTYAEPRPSIDELEKFYADEYYQTQQGPYRYQYSDDELHYFQNEARLSEYIVSESCTDISYLYDIGCGEGFFANYFHTKIGN